jgi:crossover junction endodeoxyribonuclease RuvC
MTAPANWARRFVGIDQSYTGFAMIVIDADGNVCGEHLDSFEVKDHGSGIDRLLAVYFHLSNLFELQEGAMCSIEHVAMEGYSAASKFGREKAGELGAIVKLAVYDHFAPKAGGLRYPTIVQPTTLKKFVTGNGTAKKNNMMLAVYKKWGYETDDDNLADAYALARVALALDNQITNYEYEKAALEKVKPHTESTLNS